MSIFTKFGAGLSGLAARFPIKAALRKGTKTAAILSSIALAGKLGHMAYKEVGKKVDDTVAENKTSAVAEVKSTINKSLEKFIFECVLRWLVYLSLVMLAYIAARTFNLRKDVLVAFVILGIYSFYAIKTIRILRWYVSFCRINGWMINPLRIIRAYLHKAVLDRVQRTRDNLPLPKKLAMNFFGPDNEELASDITTTSLASTELRQEAITRLGMWASGWLVYALIYEKLFLLVTGIDFNAIWEPVVWPFYMFMKIVST